MPDLLHDPLAFSAALYDILPRINPGVEEMALYEFRYCLDNLYPPDGWASVNLEPAVQIEQRVNQRTFYDSIQIKPLVEDQIVLDEKIAQLTRTLMVGLVTGAYPPAWVNQHFYFDLRGFYFLHRSAYFSEAVLAHFGGQPYRRFEPKQKDFSRWQAVGYPAFAAANAEVDACFIASVQQIIAARGTPTLLAIAGPTAAGKTEIVERLRLAFAQAGQKTTSIELDNFLTDRDEREARGVFSQGKEALHFNLFTQALADIVQGQKISIPRYDFITGTSSHNLDGSLKPGRLPVNVEPADIIFIEGNFPFLIPEVLHLIGIKVVYLTDDPVRMKRKWKRDIDYRKKYEPTYFRNRFFKEQFIMAEIAYRPQLAVCDLAVDTTGAALWATPEITSLLNAGQ